MYLLHNLITDAAASASRARGAAHELDLAALPQSHANMGNVILAEAGRRRRDWAFAKERVANITNPCLRTLLDNWFRRFEPKWKGR